MPLVTRGLGARFLGQVGALLATAGMGGTLPVVIRIAGNTILDLIVANFQENITAETGKRKKFGNTINDFPTITVSSGKGDREYFGNHRALVHLPIEIKGFVKAENSVEAADDLAASIESVFNTISEVDAPFIIADARILQIRLDEGLWEPFGLAELDGIVDYEIDLEVIAPQ